MSHLTVTRHGFGEPRIQPESLRLSLVSFGIDNPAGIRRGRLRVPAGWRVRSPSPLTWFLDPSLDHLEFDRPTVVQLELEYANGMRRMFSRNIEVRLDLQTTFRPETHAFPERNNASEMGEIGPTPELFANTFVLPTRRSGNMLFSGLYSDIVQLRPAGSHRGGLCSGMARWAGLRALRGEDQMPERAEALRQIKVLHGRQLSDRALLTSLSWFLRASPRAAFQAVRDDAMATGQSLRALDVGVPKPWRRDIARAIVREGHTIVPYRIRQTSHRRALVDCYDPNRGIERHTIEFRLDTNRYAYRNKASLDDDAIGLIAVRHGVYARKGTAVIATIGSWIWLCLGLGRRG